MFPGEIPAFLRKPWLPTWSQARLESEVSVLEALTEELRRCRSQDKCRRCGDVGACYWYAHLIERGLAARRAVLNPSTSEGFGIVM